MLSPPLSSFQILSFQNPREAETIFQQLGGQLGNPDAFTASVRDLSRLDDLARADEEWHGVALGARFFAWDGPTLHSLVDRPPIPAPDELMSAIREAGFEPSFGVKARLAHHFANGRLQVFETDRQSWRRELLLAGEGDQVLLIHRRT
jgi:hypothetical protein